MKCRFCEGNMTIRQLSSGSDYCWCDNCKCSYMFHGNTLTQLALNSYVHNKYYTVSVNYINGTSQLSHFGGGIIFSTDKCVEITPQNVHNKIRTWLVLS